MSSLELEFDNKYKTLRPEEKYFVKGLIQGLSAYKTMTFAQGNPPENVRVEKSAEDKRVMREVKCNE